MLDKKTREYFDIPDEGEVGKGKIFERIVYDFVTDCRKSLASNNVRAFCMLVELFYTNLVYSDKKTDEEFDKLRKQWSLIKFQNMMTQGQKRDLSMMHFELAMKKYRIIAKLLKSKNLYPKPAEYEVL
jgi:hypothetical protein